MRSFALGGGFAVDFGGVVVVGGGGGGGGVVSVGSVLLGLCCLGALPTVVCVGASGD